MKQLYFEIELGRLYKYTVIDYLLENDFYIFIDTKDGLQRKLHKSLFRGEQEVKQ